PNPMRERDVRETSTPDERERHRERQGPERPEWPVSRRKRQGALADQRLCSTKTVPHPRRGYAPWPRRDSVGAGEPERERRQHERQRDHSVGDEISALASDQRALLDALTSESA